VRALQQKNERNTDKGELKGRERIKKKKKMKRQRQKKAADESGIFHTRLTDVVVVFRLFREGRGDGGNS
jgi:hypothetical protein